ncbi:hypothetical protein SE17_25550, partial [Kouleothrix aurantiaca]
MHQLLPRMAPIDDSPFELVDEPLVLDRAQLHGALARLAEAASMAAIRQGIDALGAQLADAASLLLDDEG